MVAKAAGHPPVCSKRFPKRFSSVTVVRENDYLEYRRRDDRRFILIRLLDRNDDVVYLDNR